jgi:hypothetical protein
MASEGDEEQLEAETTDGARTVRGLSGSLARPLLITATFAAGAGAALGAKALLDSRRRGVSRDKNSDDDLPTVLRRAGLDLAIAATNEAAERLGQDRSASEAEDRVLQRS